MRPSARHILELVLLLAACRLGGVDLNAHSGHRKAQSTPAMLTSTLQQVGESERLTELPWTDDVQPAGGWPGSSPVCNDQQNVVDAD